MEPKTLYTARTVVPTSAATRRTESAATPSGVPEQRRPIRGHVHQAAAGPCDPADLAQCPVDIGDVFENLHGDDGIDRFIGDGQSGEIARVDRDVRQPVAVLTCGSHLIRADVVTDGPALLADRGRDLSEVCPTSTAHLEHDVTDPGVQRHEHRDAARDEVVAASQRLLDGGQVPRVPHTTHVCKRYGQRSRRFGQP